MCFQLMLSHCPVVCHIINYRIIQSNIKLYYSFEWLDGLCTSEIKMKLSLKGIGRLPVPTEEPPNRRATIIKTYLICNVAFMNVLLDSKLDRQSHHHWPLKCACASTCLLKLIPKIMGCGFILGLNFISLC